MANQRHSTAKRASAVAPLRQRPVGIYTTDEEPSLDNARDDFHPEEDTGLGGEDRRQGEKTFARWLEVETWRRPEISDMSSIMMAVESACKTLSALVKRAQTDDLAGMYHGGDSGGVNIQGEAQKKLDVVSNRIMVAQLCSPGGLSCVASEEEEYPQMCSTVVGHSAFTGEYAAVFDPLDGSANIGAGLPCGTIFGILKRPPGGKVGPRTVMQSGKRLLAAGYCLYGGQTNLVLTLGNGVQQFTLDPKRGEFVLTQPNMRIPIRGSLYSANEANSHAWDGRIQDYVNDLKTGRGPSGQQYQSRYNGALIADIHNILHYGGIFLYPADNKNPNGKLRLLYEGNPIGMIVEQAGGAASTGFQRILDVPPLNTHHRIPTFFGSPEDVYDLCAYLKRPL
ncbi:fructose-1,6-bisphosphatase class 1/Sedoheputulose-1,7-bisphosphatase [Tribonema minus]|uniref:Fructose-1,6-bisphosphatase, cytosolic n=1 Tax=Tribonema minus TaxID=303371 RepID=A0A836CLE5_9STRA|nr:fructose-1,6-bisphosphatase class 1/Sedoheputulose-1,7-bisphosphatase [Tribonema minus]